MDDLDKFDHPCRQTCSGWDQGFEKGAKSVQKKLLTDAQKASIAEHANMVLKAKLDEAEEQRDRYRVALDFQRTHRGCFCAGSYTFGSNHHPSCILTTQALEEQKNE